MWRKPGLGVVVALAALSSPGCGRKQGEAGRHYEEAGGFSYVPPDGWQVVEFPGLKYRVSHGPKANEFAPNINVVDERFGGTLDAYVDGNLENMKKLFKSMSVLGREVCRTAEGLPSVRLVTQRSTEGTQLRQTYYFFGDGNRKYVMTCTALADGGEALDPVFESSAMTFQIE